MKIAIAEPKGRADLRRGTKDDFVDGLAGTETDWRMKERVQSLLPVACDLPGDVHHASYLAYLEKAWAGHLGVVVTPDVLWYTLLCEVAAIVAEAPEDHASLFTTTPGEKQTVVVVADNPAVMPLDRLVGMLEKLVPTDSATFLPEFTTTTDRARMARYAAFADLVSPYYNYCTLACGIPYVEVRGNSSDYARVVAHWCGLAELFPAHAAYFDRVLAILLRVGGDRTSEFWKDIFRMERCGSGSQVEAFGWWTDLYRVQPGSPRFASNFASHLARVKYRDLSSGRDYEMVHGVLASQVDGDRLEPDFGSVVFHRPEQPVRTPVEDRPIVLKGNAAEFFGKLPIEVETTVVARPQGFVLPDFKVYEQLGDVDDEISS